ncbi:MAG: AAA family ATPase, partial [Pseudomonadota bacterium]
MLYALSIQSFVLIDRLQLDAATGFTALTGETGAGKSIILDAISLVLGGPVNRKQVRAGADQAS